MEKRKHKKNAYFTFILRNIQDFIDCLRETHSVFLSGGLGKMLLKYQHNLLPEM